MLHHLVMHDWTATLDTDQRMLARQFKRAPGEPHRHRCSLTAPVGTEFLDQTRRTALFGEHILGRHIGIFQVKLHQWAGAQTQRREYLTDMEPTRAGWERKTG